MSVTFSTVDELPVIQDEEVTLRADAARNREKVLAAAERLLGELSPSCVSMDAVAAEAGVGKGTLFRAFGDRSGLMFALLGEHERRLQEEIIRGPAPLGPGAPPIDRLIAFGDRLRQHFAIHGEMIGEAEKHAGRRYRSAPFAVYRTHIALLVREAAPDADWEYIADALLACLRADQVAYLRRERQMSEERLAAGWADLVHRLLGD